MSQAADSTTWTIKAIHSADELASGGGFSYRNALATPPRPMLQQRAAACTDWLPAVAEALWKEVNPLHIQPGQIQSNVWYAMYC